MSHLNKTEQLECYAFWWSEIRLIIAGVALLMGGIPPLFLVLPGMYALTNPLLKICWIISGLAALYLGYRWYEKKMVIFGGKDNTDSTAFALMIVTGLNLGFTGLSGTNIGMSIIGGRVIFFIAGVIYLVTAYYLNKRWKQNHKKVF